MQTSRIFHISDGRQFPLLFTEKGPFRMEVIEARLEDLEGIQPGVDAPFHVFLIQGETGKCQHLIEKLREARHLDDFPKVIVLPEVEYERLIKEVALIPRAMVLDDQVRPRHLKAVLEQVLQQEYYRQLVYRVSRESRDRSSAFENLLDMARKEVQTSREESAAFQALLEYEGKLRQFDQSMVLAMEEASGMKSHELLSMKSQLEATERLSDYRSLELREARATLTAAEAALDMSRKENIERERIILAMDQLRNYTDKELMELFQENQVLREKLGMPPRDT
ncbi:MAG: hypothetical protein RIF32_18730 [Leptospirales bacterium]|jgi:small nuclear ribonucleoprotein (snRNP)-like protein